MFLGKTSYGRWHWFGICWSWMVMAACSLEPKAPRTIRGHDVVHEGIVHGSPAISAERYCIKCHGTTLLGGSAGEPSCYRCHGRRWAHHDGEFNSAPEDHTVQMGGIWFHHPNLTEASTSCVSCHGSDLKGTGETGAPGCYLCHDQLWQ